MRSQSTEPAFERFSESAQISRSANGGPERVEDRDSKTKYQPGAVLYHEGQKCVGIFRIESGEVKGFDNESARMLFILTRKSL